MTSTLSTLPSVSACIEAALHHSGKSIKEVAAEVVVRPNVISMIKKGRIRVPLERVPKLADALNMERWQLMYMCLAEYEPSLNAALEACFPGIFLSPADVDWLPRARRYLQGLMRRKRVGHKTPGKGGETLNFMAITTALERAA